MASKYAALPLSALLALGLGSILMLGGCTSDLPDVAAEVSSALSGLGQQESTSQESAASDSADMSTAGDGASAQDGSGAAHAADEAVGDLAASTISDSAAADAPAESSIAPGYESLMSFTTEDLDGNQVDTSVYSNAKLTMVNVWGTFCGPCIREMPDLAALPSQFEDGDLQVMGVVIDAARLDGTIDEAILQDARDVIESTGASYTHLLPENELQELLYVVVYIPTTVFVDSEGQIVSEPYVGSRSSAEWAKIVEGLLADAE